MGNFGDLIQATIVGLVIILIIMLILRELWCWYFKFNKMVSLLTEVRDSLKARKEKLAEVAPKATDQRSHSGRYADEYQPKDIESGEWVCTCGTVNNVYIPPHSRCTNCGKGMSSVFEERQKTGQSLNQAPSNA